MAWSRFKVPDCYSPLATLATTATLQADLPPSVANVATVAGARPATEAEKPRTVATVATVAGVHADIGIPAAIPPDEVALLFERIVSAIMTNEMARADAEMAALPILRARLGNDARLAPPAGPNNQCAVCGEPEGHTAPLLPILSARTHGPVWLHRGECHARYRVEMAERVDRCVAGAGL